jgi:predicted GTPase
MRKDTKLVLVDVPGLNEAGSKDMYRDYVNAKWDTFDCVIVVMDVFLGVNKKRSTNFLSSSKRTLPTTRICLSSSFATKWMILTTKKS